MRTINFLIGCVILNLVSISVLACKVKERNILVVTIDENDSIWIEGEITKVSEIADLVQKFESNPYFEYHHSEKKIKEFKFVGEVEVSKGVVSLYASRESSYATFIKVYNELVKGFNQAREYYSWLHFNKSYNDLDYERLKVINKICPIIISEAEPNYVRRNGKLVANNSWDWCCW